MDAKTYLTQGRRLDRRINFNLRRLQKMRATLYSLYSPQIRDDRVQTSPDGEPPYVKTLMRISELNELVNRETDLLADLMIQINETIRTVECEDYQLLLLMRYIENRTWTSIEEELAISNTTAKRWHRAALRLVRMPEEPIVLDCTREKN